MKILNTLLLLLVGFAIQAQTEFITVLDFNVEELSPNQLENYQRIENQSTVSEIHFVEVGNLLEAQQDGYVNLNLPYVDCTALFRADRVEYTGGENFYWNGQVVYDEEGCYCFEGFMTIMKYGGDLIGSISVDGGNYELQSLGEEMYVLVKKEYEDAGLSCGVSGEGMGDLEPHKPKDDLSDMEKVNDNCPVRVLALFTDAADNAVPNIQNTIRLSIRQTSQALRNSDVHPNDLRLILADVQNINFTESGVIPTDAAVLVGDATVQTLRDNADADIVVVYSGDVYGGTLGWATSLNLVADSALCIVNVTEATSNYVTSHEIAHLFGCRHQVMVDPIGPFEHAYEVKVGCWPFRVRRNTIMWSHVTGRSIQYYSNPWVNYHTKPIGVLGQQENYRKLKMEACTVADFMDDDNVPAPFMVNILGDRYACPCSGHGLTSQTSGGAPGTVQYEWQTSTDGVNFGPIQSTSSGMVLFMPCLPGTRTHVRLKATSSSGQVSHAFGIYESAYTWPGQQLPCMLEVSSDQDRAAEDTPELRNQSIEKLSQETNAMLEIYPNPVQHEVNLHFKEAYPEKEVEVQWLSATGQLISRQFYPAEATVPLSTEHLPSGVYWIKVGHLNPRKVVKIEN